MPYFLDSNVLMYAAGREHPYREPCQRIIQDIADNRVSVVINTEILQELLYLYLSINEREKAFVIVNNACVLAADILAIRWADIQKAIELLKTYPALQSRDAIHSATMLNSSIKEIISTDSDMDVINGIKRIDPLSGF